MEDIKPRRTKIIATLGPATDSEEVMLRLIEAGANMVRINLSHDVHERHAMRIALARGAAKKLGKPVGILGDLQGPKLRIAKFKNDAVELIVGQSFTLNASLDKNMGDSTQVGLDYTDLPKDVRLDNHLLLDDGKIEFLVKAIDGPSIVCEVLVGGKLSNNKGINLRGGGLSADTITAKDRKDLAFLANQNVDYIALSFVKTAQDLIELRTLLQEQKSADTRIVAKIETIQALENLDAIIESSDAVMVARGDLGVELGYAELPGVQKNIIHRARTSDKAVITATEMMSSMVHQPTPTRAEVSDVANAALDGTDAVMLSAESAVGEYPVETVAALHNICIAAERQKRAKLSKHRLNVQFERIDESIAMATMYVANHMDLKAIIAMTESGSTPLWMSRIRSSVPIYAFSRHTRTCGLMTLYRGVHPIYCDVMQHTSEEVSQVLIQQLVSMGILAPADRVLITKGEEMGVHGCADTLRIFTVAAPVATA